MVEFVPNKGLPSHGTGQRHHSQSNQNPQPHHPQPYQPQSHQPQTVGPSQQPSEGTFQQAPTAYHLPQHPQQPSNVKFVRQFLYQMNPNYSATLRFVKDLDLMTKEWTDSEVRANRRLVKFAFTTENYVQVIDFEPIESANYDNMKPIISCIYWREMSTYVVTSIDIILLLEYLVNQTFDVEEKNRIRRNLQSLKPNTISRANLKDRNFFNLIMSMENPRPRNIEKDLKVFNWCDLRRAISKVMSKYYVVPKDRSNSNSSNNSNTNNQHWGGPPSQHVLHSPQVLHSPNTPFQYTPVQPRFPDYQNPEYFPRHSSLPKVTQTSPSPAMLPPREQPVHFDKLRVFDQQQHNQQPQHYQQQQQQPQSCPDALPKVLPPYHANASWPMRKNSVPPSFHSNFGQQLPPPPPPAPPQPTRPQPIPQQQLPQASPRSFYPPPEPKAMSPTALSASSPSQSDNVQLRDLPLRPSDSFSGRPKFPTVFNMHPTSSITIGRARPASDNEVPMLGTTGGPSSTNNGGLAERSQLGLTSAGNKRSDLKDLVGREQAREEDAERNKGSGMRLPSISQLLNNENYLNEGVELPSIKKRKNT
ncbi:hypothetical protein Cantr_04717 [Candida viswanathii]|uniref:DUF7082 domain-containing protein n=1 Tax=Candida viswanathii TaxID=5486 RepID=A0A367XPW5_9ASCO|nr:hypothetical protein Cantr_04717 [Candida viswanathii]